MIIEDDLALLRGLIDRFSRDGYFATRPNKAFTGDMILRSVSTRSALKGMRTIDRCVKNLRAKIEEPSEPAAHRHGERGGLPIRDLDMIVRNASCPNERWSLLLFVVD